MATRSTTAPRTQTGTTKSTPSKKQKKTSPASTWTSRAVIRDVEAGSSVDCAHCGERVKFQAKMRNRQVICNVYVGGQWDRVEHFHADCYTAAGKPHGEIVGPLDQRRSPSPAAAAAAAAEPAGSA
jgi:hypothetical protein